MNSQAGETAERMATSALALFVLLHSLSAMLCAEISIVRQDGEFVVSGWQPSADSTLKNWETVFRVSVDSAEALPILGSYAVTKQGLRFTPRYPITSDVAIRAVFTPPEGPRMEKLFPASAKRGVPTTVVEQVFPSGDTVPANLLKLYIHFSAPMSRGEAWEHIRLLDANGKALDLPFLEIDQELWDPTNQRLTVLFDPGRIKRGVLPREEVGTSLEPGARYTLLIKKGWVDAEGLPLADDYRKEYTVAPEDRTPVQPAEWTIVVPRPGTTDPLRVKLGEALDHALMERLIEVRLSGKAIAGRAEATKAETQWQFTPASTWKPGEYELVIDTILEDLAGNKVGRAFDIDTFDTFNRVTRRVSSETVSLQFRIGPQ